MQHANPLTLWPQQVSAIKSAHDAIARGRTSGLWSMPTGSGKTIAFATLAKEFGWPTLVMTHRSELIEQTCAAFHRVWSGVSVGIVKAEQNEIDGNQVVIASVQSLHRKRFERIAHDRFGLLVMDECHHGRAVTWEAIVEHFDTRLLLGCSATPERHDNKGLHTMFGREPIYSYPLRQAIDDGHLVRPVQYAVETGATLDGVAYRCGDFARDALEQAVNTPARNRVIVEAYARHAEGRRAIAFAVDVKHAHDLRDTFNDGGAVAATVTGQTPQDERRDLLADFAAGRIDVMTNCQFLTEGFDDPGVSCVLMAAPTCSRVRYTQAIGRALRMAPAKTDALILDFVDNCKRHSLVTVLDLFGAPRTRNAAGGDVIEAADADRKEAESLHIIESQQPLKWRLASVCPWPDLPTLDGYAVSAWWHDQPASEKQVKYLRGFDVDVGRDLTKGEAAHLMDRCCDRKAALPSPATSKQTWFLKRRGEFRPGLSKREASKLIGKLKNKGFAGVA